jgi:hypothetical protein
MTVTSMPTDRRIPQIMALRQLVIAGSLCAQGADPERAAMYEHAVVAVRETGIPEMLEAATAPCTTTVEGIRRGDWDALCAALARARLDAAELAGASAAVLVSTEPEAGNALALHALAEAVRRYTDAA